MLAPLRKHVLGDRALLALLRHDEERGDVDEDARTAEDRQHDEAEAEDGGCEVEVAAKAGGDAADETAVAAPLEPLDRGCVCDVFAHASRVPHCGLRDNPESPWSDPQRYSAFDPTSQLAGPDRRAVRAATARARRRRRCRSCRDRTRRDRRSSRIRETASDTTTPHLPYRHASTSTRPGPCRGSA